MKRVLLLTAAGLLVAACGLSPNIDLPSATDNSGGPQDGDGSGVPTIGDGDLALGDGDGDLDPTAPSDGPDCGQGGAGGAHQGLGGACTQYR